MSEARRMPRISTTLLLTCAALGVAGGLLLAPANWLSTVLLTLGNPVLSVAITGLWVLPSVIALRLLRRPLVGLLVGVIAGLVIAPFSGYGFYSVITNASWALPAELPFMIVLWRFWKTWMHYAGAAVLGVVYPLFSWEFFHMGSQPLWSQILFFAVTFASCVGATALGILIADKLRAAGVGRR
ncbi:MULTISPECIES: ECF transporter S component [unclassified Microbacterium]|uniref:ECF transporter S component n=1 Tax=unclassified Microbacterium TaxID=2609290 RepID=UPI001E638E52|nr:MULTISPECIES: ECF transporter S component [unclassified Microbacterium]HWK79043.1 ECF transporter S component [Microbacterium sp.]